MTLANTTTSVTVAGDGSTTTFSYAFPMGGSAAYADLVYTTIGGGTTSVTASLFAITGVTSSTGGTFTYPLSGSAIPSGTFLTLSRVVPLVQDSTIANLGTFAPAVTEGALDYLTMIAQQQQSEIATLQSTITSGVTTGGVTSIATGVGLTGGPITGTGTISITTGGITSGLLASGAIVTASLATGSVTGAAILPATITYSNIQNVAASSLLGNPTTASATASVISLGAGLAFTGSQLLNSVLIFGQTASVTVSNTTSLTSLDGAGGGTKTLTASFLTVGKVLKFWACISAAISPRPH